MLVVKKSRIKGAGQGLFTTSRIRKGDLIVEYKGVRSTWDKAMKKYKDVKEAKYIFHISDKNTIDAQFTPDELARYANDAEAPIGKPRFKNNSEYRIVKGRPYIVANKNIGAGAEIFVDYSGDYWEVMLEEEADTKKEKATKEKPKAKKKAKGKKKKATKKKSKK
jgi:SET domain-containing protein